MEEKNRPVPDKCQSLPRVGNEHPYRCLVKELNASLTKLYIPNKEGVLIFLWLETLSQFLTMFLLLKLGPTLSATEAYL